MKKKMVQILSPILLNYKKNKIKINKTKLTQPLWGYDNIC